MEVYITHNLLYGLIGVGFFLCPGALLAGKPVDGDQQLGKQRLLQKVRAIILGIGFPLLIILACCMRISSRESRLEEQDLDFYEEAGE